MTGGIARVARDPSNHGVTIFAVVWGTRVREARLGSIGYRCELCGELAVGDCFSVETADHVYYIRGKYRETARFVRCRACGSELEPPGPDLFPEEVDEATVLAAEEFVARTNPAQSGSGGTPLLELGELPAGVTRHQCAMIHAIRMAMDREAADDRVGGNMKGLVILATFAILFGLVFSVVGVREDRVLPVVALFVVVGVLVGIGLYRLHRWLPVRATVRRIGPNLRRAMAATGETRETLLYAAHALEGDDPKARRVLERFPS